jgi:hypothetical protein
MGTVGTSPRRRLVISWVDVPLRSKPPATISCQALLEEGSGEIIFQYLEVSPSKSNGAGRGATIGLEDENGLIAALYSHNGSSPLAKHQAIRFMRNSSNGSSGMMVGPGSDFSAAGHVGGPFAPATETYTISNTGNTLLSWRANKTEEWLNLSSASGILEVGESIQVVVSLAPAASTLAAGSYTGTINFVNMVNGVGNTTRLVNLECMQLVERPILTLLSVLPSDTFVLRLAGEPNRAYLLETSSDLSAWMPVSTNTTSLNGTLDLPILKPTAPVGCLYRARLIP